MFTINRSEVPAAVLAEPDASVWEQAPSVKVTLVPAPAIMMPATSSWHGGPYGLLSALGFQALHDGDELALRLAWEAQSPVTAPDGSGGDEFFPDAAALMFPLHPAAPIFMGAVGAPVCMWHWRADLVGSALINASEGIGTTRVLGESDVTVASRWSDGYWRVVFRRKLAPAAAVDMQPRFSTDAMIRVGFAVWDGNRQERAGMKAFSPNWTGCKLVF